MAEPGARTSCERLRLTPQAILARLVPFVLELESRAQGRVAIGLAGGPGSGKSTLAAELVTLLNAENPARAALVPMDGFHMKHARLEAMGQTDRKGAPHTFEAADFVNFLHRIRSATEPVSGPLYSRKIEDTVEDAFTIPPDVRVLVVEGNYLLLTDGPWAGVKPLLDYAIFLDLPRELAKARLLRRHAEEGLFTEARNRAHVDRNDLPNFDLCRQSRHRADLVIELDVER